MFKKLEKGVYSDLEEMNPVTEYMIIQRRNFHKKF